MAKHIRIIEPRKVYESAEGRVAVWRNGPADYALWFDGELHSFHRSQDVAEHEGAMLLHEQMEGMAA